VAICIPVSQALLTQVPPPVQSVSPTHSTQAGGPTAATFTQVPPAWQTGAEPGRGTPLLHVKEQLLPAMVGVVQVKVPVLTPVIRELAGRLAHPASMHGRNAMNVRLLSVYYSVYEELQAVCEHTQTLMPDRTEAI
jgi:hypothetical protein